MAELIRCDNCKKEGSAESLVGWFKLERFGLNVMSHGDLPGPWHFDSEKCLHEWAGGHATG
jgi:hypothetical protein